MATNEDLNNTDPVISTDTPQPAENGATGNDFQPTASPEKVRSDSVSVQNTGEPVRTSTGVAETTNVTPYVFGGILTAVIVAGVVLAMRVKNISTGISSPSITKSTSDSIGTVTKVTTSSKQPAKKSAAARKAAAKKTTKKRPAASRKKRR